MVIDQDFDLALVGPFLMTSFGPVFVPRKIFLSVSLADFSSVLVFSSFSLRDGLPSGNFFSPCTFLVPGLIRALYLLNQVPLFLAGFEASVIILRELEPLTKQSLPQLGG